MTPLNFPKTLSQSQGQLVDAAEEFIVWGLWCPMTQGMTEGVGHQFYYLLDGYAAIHNQASKRNTAALPS